MPENYSFLSCTQHLPMKTHAAYPLGQNRIEYIVYHNPQAAHQLLYDQGFTPPDDPYDLAIAIKELVRMQGEGTIEALLHIHPDKKAIASILNNKQYCQKCKKEVSKDASGACIGCTPKVLTLEDNYIGTYTQMDTPSLQAHFDRLLKQSNANPNDDALANEVYHSFQALQSRKATTKADRLAHSDPKPSEKLLTEKNFLIYAGIFTAGFLFKWMLSPASNSQL